MGTDLAIVERLDTIIAQNAKLIQIMEEAFPEEEDEDGEPGEDELVPRELEEEEDKKEQHRKGTKNIPDKGAKVKQ